jgi:hypothetical protein
VRNAAVRRVRLRCASCNAIVCSYSSVVGTSAVTGHKGLRNIASAGENRYTFTCPSKRCGRRMTLRGQRLAAAAMSAADAGRKDLSLADLA